MGFDTKTPAYVPCRRRMRVIVADPYPVILFGLRKILEEDPRLEVTAETSTMPAIWKTVQARRPDAVLVDWTTAAEHLGIARMLLRSRSYATPTVFLTVSEAPPPRSVLGMDAVSVSKWSSPERLRSAVWKAVARSAGARTAARGEAKGASLCATSSPLRSSPAKRSGEARLLTATGTVAARPHSSSAVHDAEKRIQQLTTRERQLLPLVSRGRKNKEIAAELGISESTVWHHLTAVFSKLNVEDRLGLAVFAYTHGLEKLSDVQDAM
jgi:DNA-binding NarL/FixJ family response regulator